MTGHQKRVGIPLHTKPIIKVGGGSNIIEMKALNEYIRQPPSQIKIIREVIIKF